MSDKDTRYDDVFKDVDMDKLLTNTIKPIDTVPLHHHNQPDFILPSESHSIRERIRKYSNGIMKDLKEDTIEDTTDNIGTSMVKKSNWDDFRNTGLLWFINTILHAFGWAIVVEVEDGCVVNAFPSRVKFRGFPEDSNTNGYRKVAKYMKENGETILTEMGED